MLKLNASYSKKVPVPGQDYTSQSYHASVEVELPDGLAPEELSQRISGTFAVVRDSVERELGNPSGALARPTASMAALPPASTRAPAPRNRSNGNTPASDKQLGFLTDLALKRGMAPDALAAHAAQRCGVTRLGELTRQQASLLIDELSGGGRRNAA